MVLFFDISPSHILLATVLLVSIGIVYAYSGGIRSVIISDVVQLFIYVSAAVVAIFSLVAAFSASPTEIIEALKIGADGASKLKMFDFSFHGFTDAYTVWTAMTGFLLLTVASHALDQDMTQRLLTCKNAREGIRSTIMGVFIGLPVVFVFMLVGLFSTFFITSLRCLREMPSTL